MNESEVFIMKYPISYEPFFETMKSKNFSTYKLFQAGFNRATYYRMKYGESVSLDTIAQLCEIMDCEVSDIIKYVHDD